MATSHEIGGIMTSQAAGFGNMQNMARSISPFGGGPPAGPGGMSPAFAGLHAPPSVFGPMGQMGSFAPASAGAGAGFAPGGAGFGGAGTGAFPGAGMQQMGMAIGGGEAAAAMMPGPLAGAGIGFMAGGPMGAAVGFGAGLAGNVISTAVNMTAGNMSAVSNIMQGNRFAFGGAGGQGATGAFGASQIGQVAGAVRGQALAQPITTAGEIREILDQMAQGGLFQAAGDIGSITNRLGEALRAMKTIALAAQTTLTEAVPIFQELRAAGFASPSTIAGMVQGMAAGQRAGISFGQQMQAGGTAAQQAMAAGLSGREAFAGAVGLAQQFGRARQAGVLGEEQFRRLTMGTGRVEVAVEPITQATQQLAMGPIGLIAGGAMMRTGDIGRTGFGGVMRGAAANLSTPENIVELLNRQDETARQILQDPLAIVQVARSMAREMPGDRDEMTMLMMQRQFNMAPVQARAMMAMFNSRRETETRGFIDAANTMETQRMEVRSREMFGDIMRRRVMNTAVETLGIDEMQSLVEGAKSRVGRFFENIYRGVVGGERRAAGPEVQARMARIIAGTEEMPEFATLLGARTTPFTQAGRQGIFGLGGKRLAGGALAEEFAAFFGEETAERLSPMARNRAVSQTLDQIRRLQGTDPDLSMEERLREAGVAPNILTEVARTAMKLSTIEDKLTGNVRQDMTIAQDVLGVSDRRVITLALAARDNSDAGFQLTSNIQDLVLDTTKIAKDMDDSLDTFTKVLTRSDIDRETGRMEKGISPTESDLARNLATNNETRDMFNAIVSGFAEGKPDLIGGQIAAMRTYLRSSPAHGEADVRKFNEILNQFSGTLGKAKAKEAKASLQTYNEKRSAFEAAGAIEAIGGMLASGLATMSDSGKESKLLTLVEDFRDQALAFGGLGPVAEPTRKGLRQASERIISQALRTFAEGDRVQIDQMTDLLEGAGLGVVTDIISDKLSRREVFRAEPETVGRVQRLVEQAMSGKAREGAKAAARAEGGTSTDQFHQRLTEYIQANTRTLTAIQAGKVSEAAEAANAAMAIWTAAKENLDRGRR